MAWLFNIRGADVAHTPLPLAFAIVPIEERPTLFVDGRKLSPKLRAYLAPLADVAEPDRLIADLAGARGAGKAPRVRSRRPRRPA